MQAGDSALDMGTMRHANDPLVVCPATIHGYHRRRYNEKPLEPQQPQAVQSATSPATREEEPKPNHRSFSNLIRRKSLRWALFQRSWAERGIALPEADLGTDSVDDQLGGLLFPYVLPGPNFESTVDGILFYPRSKEEYDKFIQTFNKDHTDEADGEPIVGFQVLDVEVFLDDTFEQRGSRAVRVKGSKVNLNCWHFIKDFDLHQRDDPNRLTNYQVPDVRHCAQLTPGFRDNAVIEKVFYPGRFIHPDEEDNTLTTSPALATLWRLPTISRQPIIGTRKRGSTIVKAIVFIAGTVPVTKTECGQIPGSTDVSLDNAGTHIRQSSLSHPQSTSSLSMLVGLAKGMESRGPEGVVGENGDEDVDGEAVIARRERAGYNRAGLLVSGEKWRVREFRELVAPRLVLGVENFHRSKSEIAVENGGGILRGRLRRWGSNLWKKGGVGITKPEDEKQNALEEKEETFVQEDENNKIKMEGEKGSEIKGAGETVEGVEVRQWGGGAWMWSRLFGVREETREMGDVEVGVGKGTEKVFSRDIGGDGLAGSWFGNWSVGAPNGLAF